MNTSARRKMRIGAFLKPSGHHVAAWRHPSCQADSGMNFEHYAAMARTAENAKLDMIFLEDSSGIRGGDKPDFIRHTSWSAVLEPLTLLAALASRTSHLGLVATATTTYNEPYHLARKFASLDHISGGRAGWNLVTSNNELEAMNFGRDMHVLHSERYERAKEFAQVVAGLWDSWEDDAFPRDRQTGMFFDKQKLHTLDHRGDHFTVRGPLNIARPPQGYPVRVQAGASGPGREMSARWAEVIFVASPTLEQGRAFTREIKEMAAGCGRNPDHVKIMPGLFCVVAESRQEAQDKYAALQDLILPEVGLAELSASLGGVDLTGFDPDGPLPPLPETNGPKSRRDLLIDMAARENLSIRDLYLRVAGSHGHFLVIGSGKEVADIMEEWFEAEAADGFNVMPPILPTALDDFTRLVVPELQRRGLFRTEYEGRTLRENLGLPRPEHPSRHVR
ncbi:FMN-dependent oxidoreductase (nitrilotriacetate monooxygenase family) [Rhodoligotrophos appendicifer]|uniref:LLM class flavin-dependent oxidoreductase n=1 Tax=Rhodoligotrophos appendicifer TaxID=987056 RepID=UPI001186BE74|nr:LLM class flavin-dependent oxidoreductase [Rhodoligotrophos appendicifer]